MQTNAILVGKILYLQNVGVTMCSLGMAVILYYQGRRFPLPTDGEFLSTDFAKDEAPIIRLFASFDKIALSASDH
jgi:hypothetical protein